MSKFSINKYFWDLTQGDKSSLPFPAGNRAVALGGFDGVHLGHRSVIFKTAGVEDKSTDKPVSFLTSTVLSFKNLPKENSWKLASENRTEKLFKTLGVNEFIQVDFSQVKDFSPEDFVVKFLYEKLGTKLISCGFNYRFGKDGSGNVNILKEICLPLGIEVIITSPITVDGKEVSSSAIREFIQKGEVKKASRMLGRPFTIDFPIIEGQRLGRVLGTPTINQPLPKDFIRPKFGVYSACAKVDGQTKYGVTNIGVRPTVGSDMPLSETWIADFSGDLYGKSIPVSLISFLRPEKKFDTIELLKTQISKDIEDAFEAVVGSDDTHIKAVLFDFDDTLQDRFKAFSGYATNFIENHFPNMKKALKEKRIREMVLLNNGGEVDYENYYTALIKRWNWKNAPQPKELVYENQLNFPKYTTLYPEVISILSRLKEKGLMVGIITNGFSLQQNRKLDFSELRPLLDIAIVTGDDGVHKPNPEVFLKAAMGLGVSASSCIYVGDNPINDIKGALSANMKPVFINTRNVEVPKINGSYVEIKKLNDVFNLI